MSTALTRFLDALGDEVLLLTGEGRVRFANRAARGTSRGSDRAWDSLSSNACWNCTAGICAWEIPHDDCTAFVMELPTGAPHAALPGVQLEQAQRYAVDIAALLARQQAARSVAR